jgi:hypothetical protein
MWCDAGWKLGAATRKVLEQVLLAGDERISNHDEKSPAEK